MAAVNDSTQRDSLQEDLLSGVYECMVCCGKVRPRHAIWTCQNCYHIFHLSCVKKWARTSSIDNKANGWRCPSCQNVCQDFPSHYVCFCGKTSEPEWNRFFVPHSCGEQCNKKRRQQQLADCSHPCNLLCHPGPCPPCGAYVTFTCFCGNVTKVAQCAQTQYFSCGKLCDKLLICGTHRCEHACHFGQCESCKKLVTQSCFCKKTVRQVNCSNDVDVLSSYSCDTACGRLLDCGIHSCDLLCHSGDCLSCRLAPAFTSHCACGKTEVSKLKHEVRTSCKDPLPTCGKLCGKLLSCSSPTGNHKCQLMCHDGPCPPCSSRVSIKCRCGSLSRKIPCSKRSEAMPVLCNKKCNKWKTCGQHKCHRKCCGDAVHICDQRCNRWLSCGLHKCDSLCHLGKCQPCSNASFDELTCKCGASVIYPPIACGTEPPKCDRPCRVGRRCGHPANHSCHTEADCPPCTFLTDKWCYGKHELRPSIPCFETAICCGLPCNKTLACEQHRCKRICHPGRCFNDGDRCEQLCAKPKVQCAHSCAAPCHSGSCPVTKCLTMVVAKCKCGHRSQTMICAEFTRARNSLLSIMMQSKLKLSSESTIRLDDISRTCDEPNVVECDDSCLKVARNRRLAKALDIHVDDDDSDDLLPPPPPPYSDFLKEQAKHDPTFVGTVYEKLLALVQRANKSEERSCSFSFAPMKSERRRVIHELAEVFGCQTQSYDKEPNKNVAATAFRNKSCIPSVSLLTIVENETKLKTAKSSAFLRASSSSRSFGNAWTTKRVDFS